MAVENCRLTDEHDGSWGYPSEHRYRHTWTVLVDSINDTAYDVLASPVLAALGLTVGQPYWGWTCTSAPLGTYAKNGTAKDENSVCVLLEPRRDPGSPLVWRLVVSYEGVGDPLAELPDVQFGEVPYQEHSIVDANGEVFVNSAFDPYRDGMAIDKVRTSLVIERPVAYTSYDPKYLEDRFKNTRNLNPLTLPGMADRFGHPITYAPGHVKLTSLTARRIVRTRVPAGVTPGPKYLWQVRAQLDFDYSVYSDGYGRKQYTRWQEVRIDAGFHERLTTPWAGKILGVDVESRQRQFRILGANGQPVTEEQLLNGNGRRLDLPGDMPDLPKIPRAPTPDHPVSNHDWYSTYRDTDLIVEAPGVLANDQNVGGIAAGATQTSSPSHGSLVGGGLAPDGSFTYRPNLGYVGWDTFTYRPFNTFGPGEAATVLILVGPRPHVRVATKYPMRNWDDIAFIVAGW